MFVTINDLQKFESYLYNYSEAKKYMDKLNPKEKIVSVIKELSFQSVLVN